MIEFPSYLTGSQSVLGFTPNQPLPLPLPSDGEFEIGTLRYFNDYLLSDPPWANAVDLTTDLILTDPAGSSAVSFTFSFTITETRDSDPCPFPLTPDEECPDRIGFPVDMPFAEFDINGRTYRLDVVGFKEIPTDLLIDEFISANDETKSAKLYGEISILAECTTDDDCEDGLFCTVDTCDPAGNCEVLSACPAFIDGCVHRGASCHEENGCVDFADDSLCEDGQTCDIITGVCLEVTPCGTAQSTAQEAVGPFSQYKNHGEMVKTAAQSINEYLYEGIISEECHGCIVSQFARGIPSEDQESCGPIADGSP